MRWTFKPYPCAFYRFWVCVSPGCALLGVDSLRGGLAEGNRVTSHRLVDQKCSLVCMFNGYCFQHGAFVFTGALCLVEVQQ